MPRRVHHEIVRAHFPQGEYDDSDYWISKQVSLKERAGFELCGVIYRPAQAGVVPEASGICQKVTLIFKQITITD